MDPERGLLGWNPGADAPPGVLDQFIETYTAWREACAAVSTAYERWLRSPERERRITYAGYQAALDGEEAAARLHHQSCELVFRAAAPPLRSARA